MKNKEINLLLLGASGSGKSSFAKMFLLHADYIDSTNDGQTTRSNIVYDLSIYEDNPIFRVKFLNQDDFITRMTQLNYNKYLLNILNILKEEDSQNKIDKIEEYLLEQLLNDASKNDGSRIEECQTIIRAIFNTDSNISSNYEKHSMIFSNVEKYLELSLKKKYHSIKNFFSEHCREINRCLSRVEGFFDIREFEQFFREFKYDSLIENIFEFSTADCISFKSNFEEYYKYIHKKIIDALTKTGIVKQNDYSFEISFNNDGFWNCIIPFCLQVKEKSSLTGMIDYVYIKDSISDEYSFVMDDLSITNLKLIDTYGLDHASWNEDKGEVLVDILYNLQQKKLLLFNSDLAVIYIKKMDSGKPTELKAMIPYIYKMIPQASIYCVLNGLDIFLGPQVKSFKGMSDLDLMENRPKSIEYLKSEEFENDIKIVSNQNKFVDYLITTIKNNISVLCSNQLILKDNFNLVSHNRNEIYKILISICMKEYSSMSIVPNDVIDNIKDGQYDDNLDKILYKIFENASKTDWASAHYRTRTANFNRTVKGETLGYSGTYKHQWNQLFHKGYVDTVTSMKSNFLGIENSEYWFAVDSSIKNAEELFLGQSYQLMDKKINDERTKFRELIEKMYLDGREEYKNQNPFESKNTEMSEIDYLNCVTDFKKGYKYIQKDLISYFRNCVAETIDQENKAKANNLLKINYDFYSQLEKLKFDFEQKYTGISFKELLTYYSDSNC